MDTTKYFIYGLYDILFPDIIRYVGCSKHLSRRFSQHLAGDEGGTRAWVEAVSSNGSTIGVKVLQEAGGSTEALKIECEWISKFPSLLNIQSNRFLDEITLKPEMSLLEVEFAYIARVIKHHNGNKLAACKTLKIGRQTLYNKLDKIVAQNHHL